MEGRAESWVTGKVEGSAEESAEGRVEARAEGSAGGSAGSEERSAGTASDASAEASTPLLAQLQQRQDAAAALCLHTSDGQTLAWRFHDLHAARRYCSSYLQNLGLPRGARVLLLCGDVPQLLAILFATLELELCLLPLHPDQDAQCLADIVAEQQPALAIVAATVRPVLQRLCSRLPWCCRLDVGADEWLQLQETGAVQLVPQPDASAAPAAVIFHSSGSTGRPKALHYTRQQLEVFLHSQRRLFQPFDDEAADWSAAVPSPRINVLPLTHWGGLSFCLQALLEGRCVHLPQTFDGPALLRLVAQTGCRLLMLVPAMYRELLPLLQTQCPAALQYCLTMGEAMPAALARELLEQQGLRLCTAYGMTEALSGLAHGAVPWDEVPHGSCGQHAFGELRLVSESGEIQPEQGEAVGELWVRNATTVPCYRDAALLQEKYVDGWYRSGDCFRRDADGHYHFLSRLDALCIHNGRNVYPQQVEAVLIEHPEVQSCVAVPLQLRDGTRRLGVYVVPVADASPSALDLFDHYLAHGAHYAAPAFLHFGAELPLTWSGKPDRASIAALLQAAHDATARAPVVLLGAG